MKKLIVLLMFLVFMEGVYAEIQTLPNVKVNTCVNIPQTCNNCTYVNVTAITVQNSQTYYINKAMEKTGSHYNYTFCNNTLLGTYIVETCGDPNGASYCPPPFSYIVNNMGESFNLFDVILVVTFLTLAGIIFFIGNTFKPEQYIIKTSFYIMALLFGLLAINSARIIVSESVNLNLMSNVGLTLSVVIFLFMVLYIFIYWTIGTIRSVKQKKNSRWEV